ncbi:SURF1 family cytochrome oxidase biogenesis protein [Nocardia seriolae]|uniref:SURF1 family cytochrome oxidase biogenesis protein n=1 Tax=Nocardia seriolae TaxID=37332 RepID=UPI00051A5261|nr:SURF1 family cytochrome oxidase biogenesis protein [Nocardia seriolae]MTJ65066.1 SURF1 family protein [Nocardia seriolae]MTJ75019.1 SURF1 family protein [Nocardia seriolae]MTJ87009.1 SURF1 family protein [Nocardia seriolae]MTK31005.1 SURF1 family protein [Nocardia seriolae]MTK43014.1 SURF1 family protein [Nocardia seriolae]
MRRFTFLLRPSWLILAVVVAGFAYLCFSVLAPWQLGKNTRTSERNDRIANSVHADPVDITTVLSSNGKNTEWHRVTADGSYVPDSTVLVRLRHLDGQPAYTVLAAFRLDDGRTLLVDRGNIAAAQGGTHPPAIAAPPAGTQRLEARVRASEGVIEKKLPMTEDGYRQVYTTDTQQEATVMGLPLTPIPTDGLGGYLQLEPGQPGAFTPDALPQLDAGPYLSYGLQWLAFGIMAPLGLGYFVWAEIRARRREKAEAAQPAATGEPESATRADSPAESPAAASPASGEPAAPADPTPSPKSAKPNDPAPAPKPTPNEARLADRYGGTRR